MIDPRAVPDVSADELLARFILQKSQIRLDCSIKPNAFMPPPDLELSVTRHRSANESELWTIGDDVANCRGLTLFGRGDVQAEVCVNQKLSIRADSVPGNPNHAIVLDWPDDKPTQKNIAQEIAARAKFTPRP